MLLDPKLKSCKGSEKLKRQFEICSNIWRHLSKPSLFAYLFQAIQDSCLLRFKYCLSFILYVQLRTKCK
jgi:hypothetical protein